jgi:hypothetical protein
MEIRRARTNLLLMDSTQEMTTQLNHPGMITVSGKGFVQTLVTQPESLTRPWNVTPWDCDDSLSPTSPQSRLRHY